ncbi:MAG: tetratricopeptide repeat protein [Candidatus Omnitrophica bacterium]|nr:tetratricopeptide repeat protein [Candidatus Omnitrophota bacterium]
MNITIKLKRHWVILTVIVFLALILRFIYLGQIASTPLFYFFSADSQHYNRIALEILGGNIAFKESVYMNPVYPIFLALTYAVAGRSLISVGIVQAVLDSLSCVLLYMICVRAFKKKGIGLLAALTYACYSMAIFYTAFLMRATISVFVNLLLVFSLLNAKDRDRPFLWLVSGIIAATSTLITSNTLLFIPLLAVWFASLDRKGLKKVLRPVIFTAGILLILTPFSFRNYAIEGRFSPFSVQGGFNFYIGNSPGATGSYVPVRGVSDLPVVSITDSIRLARDESGEMLTSSEASRYWFSKSLRFIGGNPRLFLILLGRKFLLFWNNVELASNLNFYFCRKYIPVLKIPFFSFGMIAPFAMLGLVLAVKRRPPGASLIIIFIAAYMLSLLLYFVSARYRFPCAPFLIISASYAVFDLGELLKHRKIKDLSFYVAALIAFSVFVNIDYFPVNSKNYFPTAHYNLGLAYARSGELDKAVAEYKNAIEIKPDHVYAHYNLGFVYNRKDRVDEAIEKYKEAIKLDPDFDQAYNDLGIAYRRKGLLDEATAVYKKALEINPDFAEAHYNLANVYSKKEMRAEAIAEYRKALEIDPDFGEAHNNLSFAYYQTGDYERAVYHCDKAIEHGVEIHSAFLESLNEHRK